MARQTQAVYALADMIYCTAGERPRYGAAGNVALCSAIVPVYQVAPLCEQEWQGVMAEGVDRGSAVGVCEYHHERSVCYVNMREHRHGGGAGVPRQVADKGETARHAWQKGVR